MSFLDRFRNSTEKKSVHERVAASQERAVDGKFAPSPAAAVPKQLENEIKTFEVAQKFVTGLDQMVTARNQALESMMPHAEEEISTLDYVLPILETLMPYIGVYIPGIMEKLGIAPSPQSGIGASTGENPTPSPATPPQINAKDLIERAAKTPVIALKTAMPIILSEVEKAGISPETFKQAIKNISKAI